MRRELVYLESLDSVRGPADASSISDAALFPQVLLEVMCALAMDRDVVVPYAYAFDSAVFHRVAGRVWRIARDVDGRVNPFRVHLQEHPTFEAAIASMIRRTRDPQRPFVSSRFPELNEDWELADLGYAGLMDAVDESRGALLSEVVEQFRTAQGRPTPPRPTPGLREVTGALSRASAAGQDGTEAAKVQRRLADAMARLELDRHGLGARSALRSNRAWPGHPTGATPLAILDDPEDLALVVEAVDTLYNRVVAASAGADVEHYTTPAHIPGPRLLARGVAQDLALGLAVGATDVAADDRDDFRMAATSVVDASDPDIARAIDAVAENDAVTAGIRLLLQARADPDSPFRQSIARLRSQGTEADYQACLSDHLGLVADLLGRGYTLESASRRRVGISLGFLAPVEGAAGGVGALVDQPLLGGAVALVGLALSVAASRGADAVTDSARRRSARTTYRTALGRVLEGPGR